MSNQRNSVGLRDKLATARSLAQAHLRVDPGVQSVFLLEPLEEDNPHSPIKLLEVVEGTLEGDALPVGFTADPARGIDYPVQIIEISPREYSEIVSGQLRVYEDMWTIGERLVTR